MNNSNTLIIRHLGTQAYTPVWQSMRTFTDHRSPETPDELLILEHLPVFTQGQAGRAEHILNPHDIPVIQSDRGGQVTYHGPGQIIIYLLLDLKKREQGIRHLVCDIEKSIIRLLADYNIKAHHKDNAPGVYVDAKKIASVGLRVRRGCTYHGLSFNFNMDLTPFSYINPCGYADLSIVQLSDFVKNLDKTTVENQLIHYLAEQLGYSIHPSDARGLHEAA